jgi:hypothetical protein
VASPTPPPTDPLVVAAARRARLFGVGLVAMLAVTQLPLPWRLSGLLFGVITGYAGIRLLIHLAALRRAGRRTSGRIGVSIGLALAAVLMLVFTSEAALYPIVAEQDRCTARALTHTDQQHCQDVFQQRQDEIIKRLQGRMTSAAG